MRALEINEPERNGKVWATKGKTKSDASRASRKGATHTSSVLPKTKWIGGLDIFVIGRLNSQARSKRNRHGRAVSARRRKLFVADVRSGALGLCHVDADR